MTRDEALNVTALVLIVIPLVDWLAVGLLTRAGRVAKDRFGSTPRYLAERRRVALLIALGATLGGVLGVSRLFRDALAPEVGLTILVTILVLPSLANGLWLWQALRGDFGREA